MGLDAPSNVRLPTGRFKLQELARSRLDQRPLCSDDAAKILLARVVAGPSGRGLSVVDSDNEAFDRLEREIRAVGALGREVVTKLRSHPRKEREHMIRLVRGLLRRARRERTDRCEAALWPKEGSLYGTFSINCERRVTARLHLVLRRLACNLNI